MDREKLKNRELQDFCLGLSLLLHAGVGIGDGLYLLAGEEARSDLRPLLEDLARQVDDGASLAAALRKSGAFPGYVCGLLEVGEASGRTEEALSALARHYEDRARLERRLRAALLYPAILLVIMLAVIVVLLAKVLPVFSDVYAGLGGQLTGVAGALLELGMAIDKALPVLCVLLAVVVVLLILFAAVPSVRSRVLTLWRSLWGDKGVSRKLSDARFAQSLSMGMRSGLPLEEALSLASSLLSDIPSAQRRCQDCLRRLEEGAPLAKAMGETGMLPPAECRLLELGVRGGAGDETMEALARRLSEEGEMALEERVGQVEPALVLITSILVGLILLSVMLPLMHIMTAIG